VYVYVAIGGYATCCSFCTGVSVASFLDGVHDGATTEIWLLAETCLTGAVAAAIS
jgi:hypothetical protein